MTRGKIEFILGYSVRKNAIGIGTLTDLVIWSTSMSMPPFGRRKYTPPVLSMLMHDLLGELSANPNSWSSVGILRRGKLSIKRVY